jgi:ACR3 family arsenite efflux pump ArsB
MLVVLDFYKKRAFFLEIYFSVVLYFYSVLNLFLSRYIKGFSLKLGSLDLLVDSFNIYLCLIFLRYHTLIKCTSLMDIAAVDYPSRRSSRFELNYIF